MHPAPYPTGLVIRWLDWIEQLRRAHRRDRDEAELDPSEVVEEVGRARVLVVDDIGADERPTDFSRGVAVRLLDARARSTGTVTIVTSNFALGDKRWAEHLDERGLSRLLGLCRGRVLAVGGPDRRLA